VPGYTVGIWNEVKMNVLIVYLQPKDLNEVLEPLSKIKCDKIFIKYFKYPDCYEIARGFIRNHPEYDFILWLQNDIILNEDDFFNLCRDVKKYNLDILGASMNVDLSSEGWEKCAFCIEPVDFSDKKNMPYADLGDFEGIVKVNHNGGVFIAKRDLMIKYPLKGFDKAGYNADLLHGIELRGGSIQYFLNADIHLKHLRYCGTMQVNKKTPVMEYVRN